MKSFLSLLLLSCLAFAADLRFEWTANDSAEQVTAYQLYSATNVTGPYAISAITANGSQTNLTLTNVVRGQAFYYLTASNFWGESLPGEAVSTPKLATEVGTLTIKLVPASAKSLKFPPLPTK